MSPPRYQEIRASEILHSELPNGAGAARVIAGELAGLRGPATTVTPLIVCDLELAEGHSTEIQLPNAYTTILVVQRGALVVNNIEPVKAVEVVEFDRDGDRIFIECRQQARALLLSGQPIGEPIIGQGPFVMNTREEIRQAMMDFQSGRMGTLT
jgi:redox-sensitive bicupin YhaK (pirin superfamily)